MRTLVIADDEVNQREGLRSYVDWAGLGFEVRAVFADGAELIEYVSKNRVDVILTDVKMLRTSGLEVAEYVRERYPDTFVVLLSGYREFEYAQRAIDLNVKRYLTKPVQLDEITRVFAELGREIDERNARTKDDRVKTENLTADYVTRKAKEYIERHYADDISLNDVADYVFLNPVYFSRFFKQKTGSNFVDYLQTVRVEKAVELLVSGDKKIYEIAELTGYGSVKYFTKVFKEHTGKSPKNFLRGAIGGKGER